jgi:N-acetylglutamate synthase-like GNAT family acetyltransferase/SAM-dependent methyltransferase
MDMDFQITRAQRGESATILGLLETVNLPLAGAQENVESFLVVHEGPEIIGTICMEDYGDDVLLRSLAVSPSAQGTGIGSALVRRFLAEARDAGKKRVFLLTDSAAAFFERFGFRYLSIGDMPASVKESAEFSLCRAAGADAMSLDLAADQSSSGLKEEVRRKYAAVARRAASSQQGTACCSSAGAPRKSQVTREIYSSSEAHAIPAAVAAASRGCGSPTAEVVVREGEVVLDLGCGAGADVLLAADKVGPRGRVYGVDMTEEMLDLAREAAQARGVENVEFLRGDIESIPLPTGSVDLVISNCVINLVLDKESVYREIFRVLKPGGRISITDIVATRPLPETLKSDVNLWLGCLAGALTLEDYRSILGRVGYADAQIVSRRVYDLTGLLETRRAELGDTAAEARLAVIHEWGGQLFSAAITASVPVV